KADIIEAVLLPRKTLCLALGPIMEVGESSSTTATRPTRGYRADYGYIGTLDAEIRRDRVREIGYEITDVWEDPAEAIEEVNMLRRDRRYHLNTASLVESEARISREAWA
ncbi:hypothetical protein Tco_0395348, partial [Tanacetum coccineum]